MKKFNFNKIMKEIPSLALIVLVVFAFKSSFIANYTVPTGSMQPTIEPGDKLIVNKMFYDLRIPFTNNVLKKFEDPQNGDVIVFDPPKKESVQTYIKRVIGIPGDIVTVEAGFVTINGTPIENNIEPDKVMSLLRNGGQYQETLRNKKYTVQRKQPIVAISNTWTIPEGKYFVMGDNRDKSSDSRFWGYVDRKDILGKAKFIYFSYEWPTTFRTERIGLKF